jgi:THO complex subunit 4
MSAKLDQSLDSILAARRKNARPRRVPRKNAGAKSTAPPVGGVKKPTKAAKKAEKSTAPAAFPKGESKVLISNLVCHPSYYGLDENPLTEVAT